MKCWGENNLGQNGNSTVNDSSVPVAVSLAAGALGIAVGEIHACAITGDHTVVCWGYNGEDELGNNMAGNTSRVPLPVMGLANVDQISAMGASRVPT